MNGSESKKDIPKDKDISKNYAGFHTLHLPVYQISQELRLLDWNLEAERRMEQKKVESKAKEIPCYSLLYGRESQCPFCPLLKEEELQELLQKSFSSAKTVHNVHRSPLSLHSPSEPHKNQEQNFRVVYFLRQNKDEIQLIEMLEDISSEQELREQSLLQENLSALGIMIASVFHEINNPLTGMGLNLQNLLLNHHSIKSNQLLKRLEMLRKDLMQATQILSDVLIFSNPSKPRMVHSDILQTIGKARESVQRLYPILSRKVEWRIEGSKLFFSFEPSQIVRLLINLFRNSLQALDYHPGEIIVKIRPSIRNVCLILEDNAGGIEPEKIKKIFQPFYTKHPSGHGTGLGLTVCKSIVRRHRGKIYFQSSKDRTFVYVFLPFHDQGKRVGKRTEVS